MKIVLWFVMVTMILTSCAQVPQSTEPTYNAEAAAALAQVTQAAATRASNATATQQAATAQAIYAQQTAVSSYATATRNAEYLQQTAVAFNITATAAMTSTWQANETAVHVPISVQQTSDAHALLMEREALASTATAVHTNMRIKQINARNARFAKLYDYSIHFIGALMVVAVLYLGVKIYRVASPITVYNDNGQVVAVGKSLMLTRTTQSALPAQIVEGEVVEGNSINPPQSNLPPPTKSVPLYKGQQKSRVEVPDRNSEIEHEKWARFAYCVLIDGIAPTRRAICAIKGEHYISQGEYKLLYDYIKGNGLGDDTGVGGALELNEDGYLFLKNKLPQHLQTAVNLPYPSIDSPESGEGQPTNHPTNQENQP